MGSADSVDNHYELDQSQQQVQQCLESVQASATAQRELVQQGLQLTQAAIGASSPAEERNGAPGSSSSVSQAAASQDSEQRSWFLAARVRLLQHLERLDTAVALNNGAWNPAAFSSLRDCTIAEAATALAAAGRLAALPPLLQRHPRVLLPSVLDVLAAIPETLDPKQYAQLLRQAASLKQPPPLERAPDWAESAETAAQLKQAGQYALLLATEPMCEVAVGWHPPSQRQLAAWACERAQQLDAATGQLSHAIALLEAAQAALNFGEEAVSALLATAQELLSLVKLAGSRRESSGHTWRMDLRQYAALVPAQRLSLLLGLLGSGDSLPADLSLLVAPFLARLQSSSRSMDNSSSSSSSTSTGNEGVDPQVVLRQALEQEAGRRLAWVVRVIQCETRQRAVFSSAAQLAKTAAACCYACEATDAWELLSTMLKAAGDAVRGDEQLGREERVAAEDALHVVRGHVTAARLLTKHGLTTALSTVRDADHAAALRTLRTLLARVSRTKNTESRWVDLWMDLRTIREHGLPQLSEDEVRTEFCRALLRVGQYRLCKSYLQGLPQEAAEQLVLAAGKEVYMSATSMGDRAVKQAKECLGLLPGSAAVQQQLADIAAAERLQQMGLDLPPLQLQQLRERVAHGGAKALEQLVADHPQLASADTSKLVQVAEALGVAQQQQPLLLRAAQAAHASGDMPRAQSLLLLVAEQRYKPAWQLAAAVASESSVSSATRQRLLSFALASAPPEQLLPLLERWQAIDGSRSNSSSEGAWELMPAVDAAGSSGNAGTDSAALQNQQKRQQLWLAQRLKQHYLQLAGGTGSSTSSIECGEAAALGCLLALGQRGLVLWERLLQDQQQQPLPQQQHRRALLLGLTAAALLVLQPLELQDEEVQAAAAAAEARLVAAPAELLRLLRQQQQQQQQAKSGRSSSQQQQQGWPGGTSSREEQWAEQADEGLDGGRASGSGSEVSSAAPTPPAGSSSGGGITPAAMAAAAAATAAERFHGQLLSAAAAEQLQQLVPGLNAAAALAGDAASRRRLVLQLAAAAGTPPALRGLAGSSSGVPPSPGRLLLPSPSRRQNSGLQGSPSTDGGAVRRTASRKKLEALPAGASASVASYSSSKPPTAAATEDSAAAASPVGGWAGRSLDAAAAAETLQQALGLAAQCGVPAWQVRLAFVEALLLHNQRFADQREAAAAQQLLEGSLAVLLSDREPAGALLAVLLHSVWRATSAANPQHLCLCLQLSSRIADALAAGSAGGSKEQQQWQQLAACLAACHAAAAQLLQAAPGIDAKPFLQPVVQKVAAAVPPATGDGKTAAPGQQQQVAPTPETLHWQLLGHANNSNAVQLAGAVAALQQQFLVLDAKAASAEQTRYPVAPSTVHLALFCSSLERWRFGAAGGEEAQAALMQKALQCLPHMEPPHIAAAAAFAAAGGPCPLTLPPGCEPPAAAQLPEVQQAELLAAALQILDDRSSSDAWGPAAADELQQQVGRLRQRRALLAAYGQLALACSAVPQSQLAAAREAAEAVQQAALAAGAAADGDGDEADAGNQAVKSCLQQLLTSGCPAPAVMRVAAVLLAIRQQPQQPPLPAQTSLAQPAAAAAAQEAVSAAARSAVAAALAAMSGQQADQQLSPGDAVQNLFALLRSLHHAAPDPSASAQETTSAAAAEAEASAVAALRLQVWQQLQREAAAYDGSGGAAASEAHVQVLELLGSVGSAAMWPGWSPPALPPASSAAAAAAGGATDGGPGSAYSHRQVLLFTRTAAALAVEWQAAVQQCRLSAADFATAEAAEAALLRLAAAAEQADQLRLLLRLLGDVLADAFPAALEPAAAVQGAEAAAQSEAPAASGRLEPLHRVWSACLRMLLPLGDLPGVLAALDGHTSQQQQQGRQQGAGPHLPATPLLLSGEEAAALLEAADACQGAAAVAATALLLPYAGLQRQRWDLLLQACAGAGGTPADLAAALPGLAPLFLLVAQQQPGLLVEMCSSGSRQQQLLKQLAGAALLQMQREPGYGQPLGRGSRSLSLRMAVAASAAAQLALARQYTAASWLAMQACGTPHLLQVLDNGSRVLQQLLRSCAAGSPAAAAAQAAADGLLAAGDGALVPVPHATAALLQALPQQCSRALEQMAADLQLGTSRG